MDSVHGNPDAAPGATADRQEDQTLITGGNAPVVDNVLPPWLERATVNGQDVPILGGFPLIRLLGQGGMGAVYYSLHPHSDEPVAVKILPWKLGEMEEATNRFNREGRVTAEIESPHLVRLLETGEQGGLSYLVLEYVDGCSAAEFLHDLQEQGAAGLAERDALTIALAAVRGLDALHMRGLVHRDVKPANMFLLRRTDGHPGFELTRTKLGDLGLVHGDLDGMTMTQTNVALGTPGYMAPEQTMDAKRVAAPADVFALGASIYTLLRGEPPFQGETQMEVLMATVKEQPLPIRTVRPDVSIGTAVMLHKALSKHPDDRQAHAAELMSDLHHCRKDLDHKPMIVAGHDSRSRRARGVTLAQWARGRSAIMRLPFFAATAWYGCQQIMDSHYIGPQHRFDLWVSQFVAGLVPQTAPTPAAQLGLALSGTAAGLVSLLLATWKKAWFALFICLGLVAGCLHHAAQEILLASSGIVPMSPTADGSRVAWLWLLERYGQLLNADAIAAAVGNTANMLMAMAIFGSSCALVAILGSRRPRNRGLRPNRSL